MDPLTITGVPAGDHLGIVVGTTPTSQSARPKRHSWTCRTRLRPTVRAVHPQGRINMPFRAECDNSGRRLPPPGSRTDKDEARLIRYYSSARAVVSPHRGRKPSRTLDVDGPTTTIRLSVGHGLSSAKGRLRVPGVMEFAVEQQRPDHTSALLADPEAVLVSTTMARVMRLVVAPDHIRSHEYHRNNPSPHPTRIEALPGGHPARYGNGQLSPEEPACSWHPGQCVPGTCINGRSRRRVGRRPGIVGRQPRWCGRARGRGSILCSFKIYHTVEVRS